MNEDSHGYFHSSVLAPNPLTPPGATATGQAMKDDEGDNNHTPANVRIVLVYSLPVIKDG
jgi:hypothetical protein